MKRKKINSKLVENHFDYHQNALELIDGGRFLFCLSHTIVREFDLKSKLNAYHANGRTLYGVGGEANNRPPSS